MEDVDRRGVGRGKAVERSGFRIERTNQGVSPLFGVVREVRETK